RLVTGPMTVDRAGLDLEQRHRLLVATLAATRLAAASGAPPVLADCRRWLDRWGGVGLVAAGMARQGFDFELTRFGDEGGRATFSPAGRAHSVAAGSAWGGTPRGGGRRATFPPAGRAPPVAAGSAWERTPWRAAQHAAWEALG